MGHSVTPEISKHNKWWIPKNRFLELKYFCLQYPDWKREAADLMILAGTSIIQNGIHMSPEFSDKTGNTAVKLLILNRKISLVYKTATETDPAIGRYVLKAVTEGLSFVTLKTVYEIPCERDMYYDRYRKFFYTLSGLKN